MKKIIVIGAGPAGLTAGLELLKQKDFADVIILESTDTVGGIARTVRHNGNYIDLGGHRFHSKNENIIQLSISPNSVALCMN